ncbi:MAG: hypothetical protein M3R45_01605 [Pseudomonadota bacterium]|nr:hypothetical protein [Pseudomonadota bacterium]
MKNRVPALVLCAATACFLAACGGGDDDPVPTDANALITVTSASVSSLDGVYRSSQVGLSEVDKVYDISRTTCVFSFNNLSKVGDSSATLSGKISYREGATTLSRLEVSINGVAYSSGAVDDSMVDRGNNQVTFGKKVLASDAEDSDTVEVAGSVPMRGNRPSGC